MAKKYVNELTKDELTKVYHANKKLREDIKNDIIDTEMFYISEQLDYIRDSLSDWSIGIYDHNYITVDDNVKFIEGMEEMDKSIPVFSDKQMEQLSLAIKLKNEYINEDIYSDRYYELEEELERSAKNIANMLAETYTKTLNSLYKEENQIEYLFEFYADNRLNSKCYIIEENEDFILYEDMVKSFK